MAEKSIFLDSNGWVALLNACDHLHPEASARWSQLGRLRFGVVFTDWVMAETGNSLARTQARRLFVESVKKFGCNPQFRLIEISPALRQRAVELYAERFDKTWGLVDCASFVVMQVEGITDAFTTDRHFEQAGFKCLLPAGPA
jgi:predicted nucleic acid-binding protein